MTLSDRWLTRSGFLFFQLNCVRGLNRVNIEWDLIENGKRKDQSFTHASHLHVTRAVDGRAWRKFEIRASLGDVTAAIIAQPVRIKSCWRHSKELSQPLLWYLPFHALVIFDPRIESREILFCALAFFTRHWNQALGFSASCLLRALANEFGTERHYIYSRLFVIRELHSSCFVHFENSTKKCEFGCRCGRRRQQ